MKEYQHLTQEQVHHFLEHGYLVIKSAFTPEKAAEWTETLWVRLGLDPNDKSTWDRDRIHMPWHRRETVASFAPTAWGAITELLGGEERIDESSSAWGDSFIVNLGTAELEKEVQDIEPRVLDNWHVDGDFFVHFLDSPEQALLVIPIYSTIHPRGGGTYICPDAMPLTANYLAQHPEGVLPTGKSFTPSTTTYADPKDHPEHWSHLETAKRCHEFVECTGEVGDVILLHPLMLHSASKNYLRTPRVITNPPVSLKQPFKFQRDDPDEYSLVERKTLKALGRESLDFTPTTERRRVVPLRVGNQEKMRAEELRRLQAWREVKE